MSDRGYINLVVLENSPRSEALQKAWQQYAAQHVESPNDDPGHCGAMKDYARGDDAVFPAVLGTSWDTGDLEDTANAMAEEMHRLFGEDSPPFLVTVHYDEGKSVLVQMRWSNNADEQDWWKSDFLRTPEPFGHNAPDFLGEQIDVAMTSDQDGAVHYRARMREQQLEQTLPSPLPATRTPRF